jgi:predicted transcriptional regulator
VSDKALVLDLLAKLPEEIKLREIKEELDLLVALDEAEKELDAGKGIPHEEVERRVAAWFGK